MNNKKVAVCSRSFSRNKVLREKLSELYPLSTFNDEGVKLQGDSLVAFLKGHEKAIIALENIDETILKQLPELEVISKYGVGLDMIDMSAMHSHYKLLGWSGGVNRRSVSELVISFAIALLRHVPSSYREVLSGTWRQHVGSYLSGKTVGIIGCGAIGQDLSVLLKAFDCQIIVNDIQDYSEFYELNHIKPVGLDQLLKSADIVTLHTPLDDSTRNILNRQKLELMKPSAILINAARGGLVDEVALRNMLQDNRIAAAAFDVFAVEPPEDKELLELPNFLVTPHIGGSAKEAILAMGMAAIEGLDNAKDPLVFVRN